MSRGALVSGVCSRSSETHSDLNHQRRERLGAWTSHVQWGSREVGSRWSAPFEVPPALSAKCRYGGRIRLALVPRLEAALFKKIWTQTDRELIQRCLEGDQPAWNALVNRYKRLVYHFPSDARLRAEDCDEVFQETFMAIYKQLDKLLEVDELSRWIATVAQRITWKTANRRRGQMDYEVPQEYDVIDPDDIAPRQMELKVQQAMVRQSLAMLNTKCRKLLYLLFYEHDSSDYQAISKQAGIPHGSIGPTRKRCLVKFKDLLKKRGINEKNVSDWL
ncbi:RNA polymerase sigma factor [Sulfidibacter corallicola]